MSSYPSDDMSRPGGSSTRSAESPGNDSNTQASGSVRRRPSRAGTRSVNTLSAVQLERKRANDREAQRAIRQRTKDHIESLERRINELTIAQDARERVVATTQQQIRELEEENNYLRNRIGADPSFVFHVTGGEGSFGCILTSCAHFSKPL